MQWALYYPAIIDPRVIEQQLPQALQSSVRESLEYYRQGNAFEALSVLETLDQSTLNAQLLTYRAGLYLTLGRVIEARNDIALALQTQPNDSEAYALQAIIAVVQNDKEAALQHAQQAVDIDRTSPTARLALSYAYQAHFQIEEALGSVEEALRLDGKNALVWARLSELQMSTGYLDRALESAQQAVSLNPNLGKTQTVLGFAHLLQIDTAKAKETFTKAIQFDQADPMPRLGLGLALIREGKLEAGRIELETAASLDPANSLVRSYLGKAYFEEKRYSLAGTQFDLAKERDPNDPTPWFYDAIQKQTQNRPVEALRDIQKSIELNNNRAVYRSKLLLDKDEAARGSSLARIYDNLGFEKRAIMETAKSLSHDPSNHSAHRFLADAYVNIPRHEIARVSELLQAQLLQPINVNPVQPRLAVADLNIITGTGPAALGFNEFAPLTERNKPQLVASGLFGSNSTLGNEVVASAVYDKASISVGQFHYDTKGFRQNNDQTHNVYNAFMQYAVTPKLNVQTELRHRDKEYGDLESNFDQKLFDSDRRRTINEDLARGGFRYSLSQKHNFVGSFMYSDRKGKDSFSDPATAESPLQGTQIVRDQIIQNLNGHQSEVQYLFTGNHINIVAGGGYYQFLNKPGQLSKYSVIDNDLFLKNDPEFVAAFTGDLSPNGLVTNQPNIKPEKSNGYIYTNFNFLKNMSWTMGVSYAAYDPHQGRSYNDDGSPGDRFKINKASPKFGMQWDILQNLRFRFAWFETVKSALVANQTLEPTQIAGFNQFFDDINGTRSHLIGAGIDYRLNSQIFTGVQISRRDLDVPDFGIIPNCEPDIPGTCVPVNQTYRNKEQKENLYRSYIYWVPHPRWAARLEPQYEKLERPSGSLGGDLPNKIETFALPLSFNYFDPSGFFANLTGTYVNQNLERVNSRLKAGVSDFFLLDTAVGLRLPKRRGILGIEVRNLADSEFNYINQYFNISEPIMPRYFPDRTVFARLTFNF